MTLRRVAAQPEDRDPVSRLTIAEYEALLASDTGQWSQELARSDEARLQSGEVRAMLWGRGADQAAGLAIGDFVPGVGRRLRLYLAPPYRTAEDLGKLLDELEARSDHDGAIASVADLVPGLSEAAHEEAFTARGFFRVDRLALRLPANVPLPDESMSGRPYLRPIGRDDEEGLVNLMRESYAPGPGEAPAWLFYRDPRQDAADAIREILEGRRGEWLPWASFGVDVEGALKGATLVTRREAPILSEVMVAPSCRGIGLGYHLVLESIRALRERRTEEPWVVTTSRDLKALRLARRLGFEDAEVRAVGVWVSKVAVGVSLPSAR